MMQGIRDEVNGNRLYKVMLISCTDARRPQERIKGMNNFIYFMQSPESRSSWIGSSRASKPGRRHCGGSNQCRPWGPLAGAAWAEVLRGAAAPRCQGQLCAAAAAAEGLGEPLADSLY